ncbi:MAG: response regulator [Betaproteobacteria bacterium]|nr:response regulator [Betaproteobacteria bacterium]
MAGQSKVLLLEGDQAVAMSLAAAIRKKDWDVAFASDAVLALSVARQAKPDAVILSGQLPGGGGLLALKRIRTCVHTGVIPVIAMCGGAQKGELLAAGAQECLEQPVDLALLCSAIQKQFALTLTVIEAPADVIRDPARMAALKNTGLLDSAPEESFDKLTVLASKLLGTPVALMSLVDEDR